MLGKVIIENGQKKIQALTADTGTGAPVGSYLYLEKKSNPQGYLYCDGSTFDETVYPALYQYLGTNVLPDWREMGAKGAEKNTTLIFDSTETDPRTGQAGTQNHDVFTQGEFKDDQLQEHKHDIIRASQDYPAGSSNWVVAETNVTQYGDKSAVTQVTSARKGTVTRGKSKAVFIYIKATSGLTENQQENVLNTINENNSYSTEEHPTGAKWIDGKPTYRKTFTGIATNTTGDNTISNSIISGIDSITQFNGILDNISSGGSVRGMAIPNYYIHLTYDDTNGVNLRYNPTDVTSFTHYVIVIEYTKTTD